MPNEHGQVTSIDFKAPSGLYRIIVEDMSDGELIIVADFNDLEFARHILHKTREDDGENIYTLCDENGTLNE